MSERRRAPSNLMRLNRRGDFRLNGIEVSNLGGDDCAFRVVLRKDGFLEIQLGEPSTWEPFTDGEYGIPAIEMPGVPHVVPTQEEERRASEDPVGHNTRPAPQGEEFDSTVKEEAPS